MVSSSSSNQTEGLRGLQVGRDTVHGKKGHGGPQLVPWVAGPIADILLVDIKVAADYLLWPTPTLGVCPMPSASAHMGSMSKSESQKLPGSAAASSSPAYTSHCFFLLKSWQASCMLIRQHWALAQPVTVSVLIQILDNPMQHLWLFAGWPAHQEHKIWGLGIKRRQHRPGVRKHCP